MSGHIVGFAEKLFAVNPRPSALSSEKVLSNIVLFNIIVQVVLIGYILVDDFVCFEEGTSIPLALEGTKPPKPAIEEYLAQVCGTQIRNDSYWFFIEKIFFLFFFLSIFYLNKSFVSRINRYHVIIMREKISHYLTDAPIYVNVNYEKRWKFVVGTFFIYKIFTTIFLAALIAAALIIINLEDSVKELLSYEGVTCGPDMTFVEDIDIKLICHFEHEFLIRVLSYITTILAFIILFLYFSSTFSVIFYVFKFNKQKKRESELDLHMISYKKLELKEDRNLI